jgi:hypothetical protein
VSNVPQDSPRTRFFRRYDGHKDPAELLDPSNQHSKPWGGPDEGPCDKCGAEGSTQYACLSCIEETPAPDCPVCHGRVRYEDVCPTCEGSGVIDQTTRRGVSVFPSLRGLYRYLVERDAELDGSVFVELEGELSGERDLDADAGALLVIPTRIVARHAIDLAYVAALRKRLAHTEAGAG